MNQDHHRSILKFRCPDRPGLVHAVTGFIAERDGNILELEQFVNQDENEFFMRIVWDLSRFTIPLEDFPSEFAPLAKKYSATYSAVDADSRKKMALFVSKELHCLAEVLSQWHIGGLNVDIPLVVSNHEEGRELAEKFGVEFLFTPMTNATRDWAEKIQLDAMREQEIDIIALARYMRILTPNFVNRYPDQIINIHHSFLPAFAGGSPYRQAYERGVKLIGATAHFVTEGLDEGPIIAQDTRSVSHGYSVERLEEVGREVEKKVFLEALHKFTQSKIIRYGAKTVVFD